MSALSTFVHCRLNVSLSMFRSVHTEPFFFFPVHIQNCSTEINLYMFRTENGDADFPYTFRTVYIVTQCFRVYTFRTLYTVIHCVHGQNYMHKVLQVFTAHTRSLHSQHIPVLTALSFVINILKRLYKPLKYSEKKKNKKLVHHWQD